MDNIVFQIRKKDGGTMTLEDVQEFLKEKRIIDGDKITEKDIDRFFEKMQKKVTDFSSLLTCMEQLASETKEHINETHEKLVSFLPERGIGEAFKETALDSLKHLQVKIKDYIVTNNIEISLEKITEWISYTEIFSKGNEIGENLQQQEELSGSTKELSGEGKSVKKEELRHFIDNIPDGGSINVAEFKKKFDEWSKMEDGGSTGAK